MIKLRLKQVSNKCQIQCAAYVECNNIIFRTFPSGHDNYKYYSENFMGQSKIDVKGLNV